MVPRQISGFSLLPVAYSSSTIHFLYIKAHATGKQSATQVPGGRSLFVVNVPPDASREELLSLFRPHGPIEKVIMDASDDDEEFTPRSGESDDEEENEEVVNSGLEEKGRSKKHAKNKSSSAQSASKQPIVTPLPTISTRPIRPSGKAVYIVYVDESSVQRALSTTQSTSSPSSTLWPSSSAPRGIARYSAMYDCHRPPLTTVRAHADTSLELFDYQQAERKAHLKSQYKKGEAIVDDDGFTLVTRGGAYGQSVGGGVAVASKKFEQSGVASESRRKKKKLPKEKDKFYAFQLHEKKRDELVRLKREWEADKAKVSKLRQERKFKPY